MFSTCTYKKISNSGKEFIIGSDLDETSLNKLNKYFGSFKSIFVNELQELNVTNIGSCFIRSKIVKPIVCQSNKLTRKQNEMLAEKVGQLLRLGVVQHSSSEWCSNAYAKEIDNGELLLYVNYSKLNETLEEMDFKPITIEDELRHFEKSFVFSKIVIKDAFYQIPMNAKDKKKTAFLTELGKFEFNVMPYNLKNSEKTFNKILRKVIGYDSTIKVHSEQILIHTKDFESNLIILKNLFKNLRDANFKVDAKKSCFCVESVAFAGYEISSNGFAINPDCIEKIRMFPTPKIVNELNSFLDLTNSYKKFIQDYGILIQPLLELTTRKDKFSWNLKAKNSFHQLINSLLNAPTLGFFQEGQEMQLKTEVSLDGYKSVLEQKDGKNNWRALAFCSSYQKIEKSELCRDLEREAVLDAINEFENLINEECVKIITKHDGFGFLTMPGLHRIGELYLYKTILEYHSISSIEHDPNSKHEFNYNCFDGNEFFDQELDELWFNSDSD